MSAQQPSPPGDALRQAPPTPTPHIGEHMCLVMWPWGCQILQALNRKPTQELGCFLRKSYINCNHRVPCIHSTYLDEPALLWDFPEAQNRKRPRKQFPTKKNHRECHLGEYLISPAQDLPTSSTPASSPQSRSSGNKFVSHTFNKEKNKNWNSFSPLTKWRKEEMKISTGARQLWTVSGALWWKKPGEFSIKFFFTFPEQTGKSEYFCSYCLSRLGFLHQGCWIRWTAWTACIWRPETTRFCKPHLRTEQRTLAGPLQVFKKRLIRRHVDVSQSY